MGMLIAWLCGVNGSKRRLHSNGPYSNSNRRRISSTAHLARLGLVVTFELCVLIVTPEARFIIDVGMIKFIDTSHFTAIIVLPRITTRMLLCKTSLKRPSKVIMLIISNYVLKRPNGPRYATVDGTLRRFPRPQVWADVSVLPLMVAGDSFRSTIYHNSKTA